MVRAKGMIKLLKEMVPRSQNGSFCMLQASKQSLRAGGSLIQPPQCGQTLHASGLLICALIFLFPWGNSLK